MSSSRNKADMERACRRWALAKSNPAAPASLVSLLFKTMCLAVAVAFFPPLVHPRNEYRQPDFPPISFWTFTRKRQRDAAFMAFLGVPTLVFDDLCERAREHLPQYDSEKRAAGRPSRFDYKDVIVSGVLFA